MVINLRAALSWGASLPRAPAPPGALHCVGRPLFAAPPRAALGIRSAPRGTRGRLAGFLIRALALVLSLGAGLAVADTETAPSPTDGTCHEILCISREFWGGERE